MSELAARCAPILDDAPAARPSPVFPELEFLGRQPVYGVSFAEILKRDAESLAHTRRLPGCGLRSSHLSVDVHLDKEETIDLGEFHFLEDPRLGEPAVCRAKVAPPHVGVSTEHRW